MSLEKHGIVMKTCVKSQFGYCPLIWMLHCRTFNDKINRPNERVRRIVYSDCKSSLITVLKRIALFQSIMKIFKSLAIEMK